MSNYIIFGNNILIRPIEEDRTEFEKMILEDNEHKARVTKWGEVIQLGKVNIDVQAGDIVRFNSGTSDYNERERMYIVTEDKIILRKERSNKC